MSEVICHVLRLPPFMAASKTAEIQGYDFRISNLEIITLRVQNAADVLSLSKSAMFQKGKIPRRQCLFLQAGFAALFKISGKCSSSLAACGSDALACIHPFFFRLKLERPLPSSSQRKTAVLLFTKNTLYCDRMQQIRRGTAAAKGDAWSWKISGETPGRGWNKRRSMSGPWENG